MLTIKNSYYFSVFIQILSLIIFSITLNITIPPNKILLKNAYTLEYIVSIIEFLGYIVLGLYISSNKNITAIRYGDWFITTNFLLLSLSSFLLYNKINSRNINKSLKEKSLKKYSLKEFFKKYFDVIIKIIIANSSMLLVGFLGEINYINKWVSLIIGMIFFIISFYLVFKNFVGNLIINNVVFLIFTIIWLLYALAFMFDYKTKNIAYNFLDLIIKNCFGIFIYLFIRYG